MSARCIAWAFAFRVGQDNRAKLALLALAEEADWRGEVETGDAMVERIAARTEMRPLDVRNALIGLIACEAISARPDGERLRLRLAEGGEP